MSWKALDWATDINVGSPTMRLILILLANKADEQFSCYPSVRTLMAESCAARSTVLKALNGLEHEGLSRESLSITNQGPSDAVATSSIIQMRHISSPVQIQDPRVRRRDGRGLALRPGGSTIWTPGGSDVR